MSEWKYGKDGLNVTAWRRRCQPGRCSGDGPHIPVTFMHRQPTSTSMRESAVCRFLALCTLALSACASRAQDPATPPGPQQQQARFHLKKRVRQSKRLRVLDTT